ncbi:MAG: tRNA (adenosine(37)-N6)-threonylcarbamoyltransferase complex ATPase subunit type 1 TsaE [Clostridia bacterium]|nr:tRNA (adenosine(37)-N6)-threonylcarbamoyltransferase complex ATPase subunit type 1 TsaE [Clostridia bacterium]
MEEIISNSPNETIDLGKKIGATLKCGDILILSGDLGAGKTKFTEGILSYFGLQNEISSPTFTIVNEYYTNSLNIYHFDVYRIEDQEEFFYLGGDEYFKKGVSIIEWGEKIEKIIPKKYIKIDFSKSLDNENVRIIKIKKIGY